MGIHPLTKPILLIDGDILLYKAVSSAEKAIEWDTDLWVMFCDHGQARDAFIEQLGNITKHVPEAIPYICLTHDENFRKDVYPLYKSNRKNTRKPMGYPEFKAWVQATYTTIIKPGIEADDCIGILATKPGNNAIVSSGDKDLKQIPGKHLVKGELITVTQEEGDRLFYTQTLTGDAVDGYPGCPGIGPVKAEKIIGSSHDYRIFGQETIWRWIVRAYEKAGLTKDDALAQARCAKILRWEDWDAETQTVNLWNP